MAIPRRYTFLFTLLLMVWGAVGEIQLHAQPAQDAQRAHAFFRVQAPSSNSEPISGRLLIFLKAGSGDKEVNVSPFHPSDTWVAAKEVRDLAPGASVEVNADEIAYP